jgi:hypothetical protein
VKDFWKLLSLGKVDPGNIVCEEQPQLSLMRAKSAEE